MVNKLVVSSSGEDKKIITYTINSAIKQRLKNVLISSEKYNLKKKSQWVNEAILALKENPDYRELVCNAEGYSEEFVFDKIYMDFNQRCLFAEMRNETVKMFPDIRGPQAAIVRAAILNRLVRKT